MSSLALLRFSCCLTNMMVNDQSDGEQYIVFTIVMREDYRVKFPPVYRAFTNLRHRMFRNGSTR